MAKNQKREISRELKSKRDFVYKLGTVNLTLTNIRVDIPDEINDLIECCHMFIEDAVATLAGIDIQSSVNANPDKKIDRYFTVKVIKVSPPTKKNGYKVELALADTSGDKRVDMNPVVLEKGDSFNLHI